MPGRSDCIMLQSNRLYKSMDIKIYTAGRRFMHFPAQIGAPSNGRECWDKISDYEASQARKKERVKVRSWSWSHLPGFYPLIFPLYCCCTELTPGWWQMWGVVRRLWRWSLTSSQHLKDNRNKWTILYFILLVGWVVCSPCRLEWWGADVLMSVPLIAPTSPHNQ